MTDYSELKRLAEAFPANLDWDSNEVPFSLHPEYGVVGGESDGTYTVFGEPFRLEGEDFDYDGPIYVSQCGLDFAKFMVAARDGVLELIAENERLEQKNDNQAQTIREYSDLVMGGDVSLGMLRADLRVTTGERDQLRAEVEALRKDAELYVQIQRAAAELPTGWEIRVCVEHESGYVELWAEDGCEVDFPNSCETLGLTVSDAIDAAVGKESGQ